MVSHMTQKEVPAGASRNNRHSAKRDRSWSLLMVGDHGQIIPFRRVKGIAITLITLATLAILAAVGLGFWGAWLRMQNAGLETELEEVRQSIRRLKDEKDLLMAKVVILETHNQKSAPVPKPAKAVQGSTATKPVTESKSSGKTQTTPDKPAKAPAPAVKPQRAQSSPSPSVTPPAIAAPKAPAIPTASVAVSAFIADHRPRNNALSARFKIKNTGPRGQRVAGRCVLVLKNAVKSDMEWVSVPHVSLISGRPNGKQGRAFKIANFMTLKMQTERVPDNFAFETGTLYVFDNAGKQLLEKEVPVQLSYRKPPSTPAPAPEPAATETRTEPAQPLTLPAHQTPVPTPSSEASPAGPIPAENVKPVETAVPSPTPGVDPRVPVKPAPNSMSPEPTPPPTQISEPAAPSPMDVGDDPSLTTGSEATPSTEPPEQGTEDAR
jgi:hypothetical protein